MKWTWVRNSIAYCGGWPAQNVDGGREHSPPYPALFSVALNIIAHEIWTISEVILNFLGKFRKNELNTKRIL